MNMLLCRNEQLVKCSDSHMQCLVDDARRIEHIKNTFDRWNLEMIA